jgi:hypothetical protein
MYTGFPITLEWEGALRMSIVLRMSKTQILALVLFIVFLIAIGLVILHGAAPGLWHTLFSFGPDFVGRHT